MSRTHRGSLAVRPGGGGVGIGVVGYERFRDLELRPWPGTTNVQALGQICPQLAQQSSFANDRGHWKCSWRSPANDPSRHAVMTAPVADVPRRHYRCRGSIPYPRVNHVSADPDSPSLSITLAGRTRPCVAPHFVNMSDRFCDASGHFDDWVGVIDVVITAQGTHRPIRSR